MAREQPKERDKYYRTMFIFGALLVLMNAYYFAFNALYHSGMTAAGFTNMAGTFSRATFMKTPYTLKLWAFGLACFCFLSKDRGSVKATWKSLFAILGIGSAVFFLPPLCRFGGDITKIPVWAGFLYCATSISGYLIVIYALSAIARKFSGFKPADNDLYETFQQNETRYENDMSINWEYTYQYKHKKRTGQLCCIQPQRGNLILGTPGSGKSFSLYNGFIQQMIAKGFSLCIYDFKLPDLAQVAWHFYNKTYPEVAEKGWTKGMRDSRGRVIPQFCVINFDDPRYSHRCNPINPKYLTDPSDVTEVVEIIWRNINPGGVEKEGFFEQSAKAFIGAMINLLRIHKGGIYCDFPHLIELMSAPYEKTFEAFNNYPELMTQLVPFADALNKGAMEQLAGQIASAQIPLLRFISPSLYWVLSGDDVTLDINNPADPKILVIGNNPDRQSIYGTTLALYTSRIFKTINHKGKVPCGVLLDEFPTVKVNGIDNVIATARSNKVCVVLGAQDKSQIIRDYGEKDAEVVFNTVGNIFAGQVNGRTAKELAETFGKEFRMQQSETTGGENDTVNTSYQLQEILPQSRIEQLSPGTFFGKVADDNQNKIRYKLFCGEIHAEPEWFTIGKNGADKLPRLNHEDFGDEAEAERIRSEAMNETEIIDELINRQVEEEERQKRMHEIRGTVFTEVSPALKKKKAQDMYDAMTEDERKAITEEIVDKMSKDFVDRVVNNNYRMIRKDIVRLFKDLNVVLDENTLNMFGVDGSEERDDTVMEPEKVDLTYHDPYGD